MKPIDSLTVCVTNFRRPEFLRRCLESLRVAGCPRVVVASMEPDASTRKVIAEFQALPWTSFDVAFVEDDLGCNDTWMLAAYHSRTKRIIIMHDDDMLAPEFGEHYNTMIGPTLDREPTAFATWRADLIFMDGRHEATDFWSGPTRMSPSRELLKVVGARHRLSLSPIISVFDRETVIHACKEGLAALTTPECYHNQGMLLGTEIMVYMRHIQRFPKWLYVDKVLSHYGSHAGSGTVEAQNNGDLKPLWVGYDRARAQAETTKPALTPRILLVYSSSTPTSGDEMTRNSVARMTWDFHFGQGTFIEMPVRMKDLTRSSAMLQDTRNVPFIRDLFDWGCAHAMPEDIVLYCNRDIGLVTDAARLIGEGIVKGRGITCCPRRWMNPKPGRMYKNLVGARPDGGFDAFAVTPNWWAQHRGNMPDMLIGREAWDTVLRTLAEEWADQRPRLRGVAQGVGQLLRSNAYTDQVCFHKNHNSHWIAERLTSPGNLHNRRLAKEFFQSRNNTELVKQLS